MWKRDRWMIARLMALVAVIGATWLVWHGQQLTQAEQGGNIGPPDQLDSVACLDISGSRTGCNAILPAGSEAADVPLILLFSSGGLEINIEVGETPHDALLRWKAT